MEVRFSVVFSVVLLLVSAIYVYMALKMPFGTLANPGPSFFPVITGSLAFVLTFVFTLRTIMTNRPKSTLEVSKRKLGQRFVLFLLGMLLYVLLLKPFGFVITTLLLSIYLMKVTSVKGWIKPIIYSILVVLMCYLIFIVWLGIPLP